MQKNATKIVLKNKLLYLVFDTVFYNIVIEIFKNLNELNYF